MSTIQITVEDASVHAAKMSHKLWMRYISIRRRNFARRHYGDSLANLAFAVCEDGWPVSVHSTFEKAEISAKELEMLKPFQFLVLFKFQRSRV